MPLLDIAISQPCSCFYNKTSLFRSAHFQNKIAVGNDRVLGLASTFPWKALCIKEKVGKNLNLGRVEVRRSRLMIRAVATFEITSVAGNSSGVKGLNMDFESMKSKSLKLESKSSIEDYTETDDKEKLRRMRISKANKGNTPWNKGRKHSPETLQRIRERTRLAMQDPKVKMKLVNLGHAQSEETRIKIGVGVRLGWEKRRERLMVQETCHYEWLNLIAEAARKGLVGEEELQWDSYKILDKQLEKEWLQSVEKRKCMPRPKGSKRAPKSAEQKRKISEAISAKWADPDYRTRVCSALAKYHGITDGVERKPRRKPSVDGQTPKRTLKKKDESDRPAKPEAKTQTQRIRLRRSRTPSYKDPLANTKLEMLKSIRAQRVAAVDQKTEAINRAKLLISEAEKAAEALEKAAQNSPVAQASLLESRMLIAEAIQFLTSIENEEDPIPPPPENDHGRSENSPESVTQEKIDADTNSVDVVNHKEVNGFHSLSASSDYTGHFSFNNSVLPGLVNGYVAESSYDDEELATSSYDLSLELKNAEKLSSFEMNHTEPMSKTNGSVEKPLIDGMEFQPENTKAGPKQVHIVKKWIRGRLVEVAEET